MTAVSTPRRAKPPLPVRPEHLTRESVEERLAQTVRIREAWKGHPEYVKRLDLDIYGLQLALEDTFTF